MTPDLTFSRNNWLAFPDMRVIICHSPHQAFLLYTQPTPLILLIVQYLYAFEFVILVTHASQTQVRTGFQCKTQVGRSLPRMLSLPRFPFFSPPASQNCLLYGAIPASFLHTPLGPTHSYPGLPIRPRVSVFWTDFS